MAKKEGRSELVASSSTQGYIDYHTEKVRMHLHIVLAMSPTGNSLNQWIRDYPSLVNCSTIDYFFPWPHDALKAVASHFLKENSFDEDLQRRMVNLCKEFHVDSRDLSERF